MPTTQLERKTLYTPSLEIKAADGATGERIISGYAAVFNNLDDAGDILERGAVSKSLPRFLSEGVILQHHGTLHGRGQTVEAIPIAMPIAAHEDDHGVWLEAKFHTTPQAEAARVIAQERLEQGKSVAFSIGYTVPKGGETYETKSGKSIRRLRQINLLEVSLVNYPANPLARVHSVKSAGSSDQGQPHDGLTMAEHGAAVLEAVEEYTHRYEGLLDLRTKVGKRVSAATRKQLQAIIDVCQELLDADAREAEVAEEVEEVEEAVAAVTKSAAAEIELQPEPEPVQVKAAQEPAQKPVQKKRATAKPGEPGTVEWYRRRLQRHESFAIRNGIALSAKENTQNG